LNMDKGKTLYKNLNCLQNGSFVIFDDKLEIYFNCYYDLFSIKNNRFYKFDSDLFFELKSIYCQAVKSRCRSNFEVGLFLSSGLDSMSVAAVGAQELKSQNKYLNSYTSAPSKFSNLTKDEMKYADETDLVKNGISNYDNIKPIFCRFEDFKFSDIDFDTISSNPLNPYLTVNYFWLNGILQIARQSGVRSILTGQMGNFTISSDGFLVHLESFKNFQFSKLFKELTLFANEKKDTFLKAFKIRVLQVLKYQLKTLIKSSSKFSIKFFHDYGALDIKRYSQNKSIFKSKRNELIPNYFYLRTQRGLRLKQLEKNIFFANSYWYLYSMMNGVEVLDPTCDERIICFSLSIPEYQFFRKGIRKYIYKGVFAGLVNKRVLENTKPGIQAFDFADRLMSDSKSIQWLLDYKIEEGSYNLLLYKNNLEKLMHSVKPNFERIAISKILHFISVHNFSRNFKKS